MSESPQLTLAQLDAARARIPDATWLAMSHREQSFVAALVSDPKRDATRAAKAMGAPARSAKQRGHEFLHRPAVRAALDALAADLAAAAKTDAAYVVRRLRENDETAFAAGDLNASNTALGHLGKATGAFEKRVRVSFDDPAAALAQLKAMPRAERERVIRAMLEGA